MKYMRYPKGFSRLSIKDLKVVSAKNLSSYSQRIQDMVKDSKLWSSIQSHGQVSKVMVKESKSWSRILYFTQGPINQYNTIVTNME